MESMCASCKKRDKCKKLCPEAEKYVDQDSIHRSYLFNFSGSKIELFEDDSISDLDLEITNKELGIKEEEKEEYTEEDVMKYLDKFKLSPREKEVVYKHVMCRITFAKIAKELGIGLYTCTSYYKEAKKKIIKLRV